MDNVEEKTLIGKHIQPFIIDVEDQSFHEKYTELECKLETFKKKVIGLRGQRQLSVHYDAGIDQVYRMMNDLNPFCEFYCSIELLNLLKEILALAVMCMGIIDSEHKKTSEKRMTKNRESIDKMISLLKDQPSPKRYKDTIQLLEKI